MLYRKFYDELIKWYNQEKKLALLIDGARQIGKTTIIRQFAKDYYGDNFVEINFINTPSAKEIFVGDLSVDVIISKLTLFLRRSLTPHKTLIFFDEVQECLEVRTAIKFLVDDGRFDYIESARSSALTIMKSSLMLLGTRRTGLCTLWILRSLPLQTVFNSPPLIC